MLIGREREQAILQKTLRSEESEMVAVIGRRRVGKTYLVRSVYADKIRFETSGVQDAPLKEQLNNFNFQLKNAFGNIVPAASPKTWQDAFFSPLSSIERRAATPQRRASNWSCHKTA